MLHHAGKQKQTNKTNNVKDEVQKTDKCLRNEKRLLEKWLPQNISQMNTNIIFSVHIKQRTLLVIFYTTI